MLLQYKKLFDKAIRYWGIEKQLNMVSEENSEIDFLLAKERRYDLDHILSMIVKANDGTETIEHKPIREWLTEECADGLIMLSELAVIVGPGTVNIEIERKIDRLRERIYKIDHANKEIKCFRCDCSFTLDKEIPEDLECEHCNARLYKVGFSWKIIDQDGPTYDLDIKSSASEQAKSFALARYGERALPSRGDYGPYSCASSYSGTRLSDEKLEELSKLFHTETESDKEMEIIVKEFHRERREVILKTIKSIQEQFTEVQNAMASASSREEENKMRPKFSALREVLKNLEALRTATVEEELQK